MRYEFTGEIAYKGYATLHRIRYLDSGELGGWIESEENLMQYSDAGVYDNAKVYGRARICDRARVGGDSAVFDNAMIYQDAQVFGHARIFESAGICGAAKVHGYAWVRGTAEVREDAEVFENAYVSGRAIICGRTRVYGSADICGRAVVRGRAEISGNVHLSGGALVDGDFWDVPPLQIQGTRHFFSVSSKTSLTVGCQTKTADEWLACYEALFDGHGYSREARDEYKRYFNLAADLYGWDVPRFELDGAGGE